MNRVSPSTKIFVKDPVFGPLSASGNFARDLHERRKQMVVRSLFHLPISTVVSEALKVPRPPGSFKSSLLLTTHSDLQFY